MVSLESYGMISYLHSIVTMAAPCIISEKKARYWSIIVIISHPWHSMLPLRGSQTEYCHNVWYRKSRKIWLPNGVKSMMICLAISTKYRGLTDRDGQTNIL